MLQAVGDFEGEDAVAGGGELVEEDGRGDAEAGVVLVVVEDVGVDAVVDGAAGARAASGGRGAAGGQNFADRDGAGVAAVNGAADEDVAGSKLLGLYGDREGEVDRPGEGASLRGCPGRCGLDAGAVCCVRLLREVKSLLQVHRGE